MSTEQLALVRDALSRHDWGTARSLALEVRDDDPAQEATRLDLLADACWWLGRLDECIEARERAYEHYDSVRDDRRAGQCAVWLYEHHCFKARPAIAGAWLRRASSALAADTECIEYGGMRLREAECAHGGGDLDRAAGLAREAIALGRRLRAHDLEAEGLQTLGRVLIDGGSPKEGLELLDEAMLLAIGGRLGPYATGKVYCSLISACEELGDVRRAAEWTEATMRWAQDHPFAVFPGLCRVHRASALQWRGAWVDAEAEAAQACSELALVSVPHAAAGFAQIGDIRRRLGDLEGSEAAFASADRLCSQPRAGLALLRLAQGDLHAATDMIARALDGAGWNRLARAPLLAAAAQIALATGDLTGAAASVEELEQVAAEYAGPVLLATAATCRGRLLLAQRDQAASGILRRAVASWQELDVPYEVATAQLLLGLACRDAGDAASGLAAFAAAEASFAVLGATIDLRRLHDLTAPAGHLPGGLTERETEVLRLVAAGNSNRAVATALYLSEKTVARHVSNIFTKLGVSSRVAATTFAYTHRLVEYPAGPPLA